MISQAVSDLDSLAHILPLPLMTVRACRSRKLCAPQNPHVNMETTTVPLTGLLQTFDEMVLTE